MSVLRDLINQIRFEVDYSGLDEARRSLTAFREEVIQVMQAAGSATAPVTETLSAVQKTLQQGAIQAQDAAHSLRKVTGETVGTGQAAERSGSLFSRVFATIQAGARESSAVIGSVRDRVDSLGASFSRLSEGAGALSLFNVALGATAGAAIYAATVYEHARIQAEAMTEASKGSFTRLSEAVQRTVRETRNFISEGDLFGIVAQAQKFGLAEDLISEHLRDIVRVAIATGSDVQSVLQGIAFSTVSGFTRGLRGILSLDQLTALQRMRLSQMSAEERAQVILNMVRERSLELTNVESRVLESSWGRLQRFKATVQDFFETAGGVLLPPVMAGLEVITRALSVINETPLGKIAGGLIGVLASVTLLSAAMRALRGTTVWVLEGLQMLAGTRIGAWFQTLITGATSARGALTLLGRALPIAGIYLLIDSLIRLAHEFQVFRFFEALLKPLLDVTEKLSKPLGVILTLTGALMVLRGQVISGLGVVGFGLSLLTSGTGQAARGTQALSESLVTGREHTEKFSAQVDWLTFLLRKLGLQAEDTGEKVKKMDYSLPGGLSGAALGAVTGFMKTPGGLPAKVGGAVIGGITGGLTGAQIGAGVQRDTETGGVTFDAGKIIGGVLSGVISIAAIAGGKAMIGRIIGAGKSLLERAGQSILGSAGKVATEAARDAGKIIVPGMERVAASAGKIIVPPSAQAEITQAASGGLKSTITGRIAQVFQPSILLKNMKFGGLISGVTSGVTSAVSEMVESGSLGRSLGAGIDAALGMGAGSAIGAAIGSVLLPGVGTVAGGVLGGMLGSIGTGVLGLFKNIGGWVEEKITGQKVGPREAGAQPLPALPSVLHTPDFLKQGCVVTGITSQIPLSLSLKEGTLGLPVMGLSTMLESLRGREDMTPSLYTRFQKDMRHLSPEMSYERRAFTPQERGGGGVHVSVTVNVPILPPTDMSRLDWGDVLGKYRTQLEEFTTEFFLRELEVGMKRLPPDDTHYHRPN